MQDKRAHCSISRFDPQVVKLALRNTEEGAVLLKTVTMKRMRLSAVTRFIVSHDRVLTATIFATASSMRCVLTGLCSLHRVVRARWEYLVWEGWPSPVRPQHAPWSMGS